MRRIQRRPRSRKETLTGAFGLPAFSTAPQTSSGSGAQAQLSGIAAGCHGTFDRFVIRVSSGNPGYDVRFVSRIVADPSGRPVSLQGSTKIRVLMAQRPDADRRRRRALIT